MPVQIPLTPIGDRAVSLEGESFSLTLRSSCVPVSLTEHYEGRVRMESPGFGSSFLFIGEMYERGALGDLLDRLDSLCLSDLKECTASPSGFARSIEEMERGGSTLALARNVRRLAETVEEASSRCGLIRLSALLSERYETEYGRQMRRYIRAGQLEEAGTLSIDETPVHVTPHAELAKLVVRAFSTRDDPHASGAWMNALEAMQRVGYPLLSEAIGAFTLRRLQTHIYLGFEARSGLREGDLLD